jgi:hypothetical protein
MRIISIRLQSVARILAIIYAVFGAGAFCVFAFGDARYLTLPFGKVGPLFHLNIDFNLARSSNVFYIVFCGVAEILAYALTGWVTGAVMTLCFNLIARQVGGIDVKYVSTVSTMNDEDFERP